MAKHNHHFGKLGKLSYTEEISQRIREFQKNSPDARVLNLSKNDFNGPLPKSALQALQAATAEMGDSRTFKGYGPSQGYDFLREAIAQSEYASLGISADEIFISDGAQSDLSNLQEIFASENRIAISNPSSPTYVDTNVIAGRTRLPLKHGGFGGILYLPCNEKNRFSPEIPNRPCDLLYLSSPHNPTGLALGRPELEAMVRYAKEHQAVILFDGTFEAFIRSPNAPRSIYEIEGAKQLAIEIRSFSKNAGFSGLRCSYTVIPHELKITEYFQTHSLNSLWKQRQEAKFGGVSYPVQKAAAATFSPEGKKEVRAIVDSYLASAALLRDGLTKLGYTVYGGQDSPYLWVKTPVGTSSWDFFQMMLKKAHIACTPGVVFGSEGEGFVRLSAFATDAEIKEAIGRIAAL